MTYQGLSTTWIESIAVAAALSLSVLIAGDAYLQHKTQVSAAEPAMPMVRLEPVTITAQRQVVQLEPVTIVAARTTLRAHSLHSAHSAPASQFVAAHLPRI